MGGRGWRELEGTGLMIKRGGRDGGEFNLIIQMLNLQLHTYRVKMYVIITGNSGSNLSFRLCIHFH